MTPEGLRYASGDRVGPYDLVAPLGRGGFSEVWRVRTRGDERDYALKVVTHPDQAHQLRQEARSVARVRGPGIVPLDAVELGCDPPYLVMPVYEGGTLRDRMQRTTERRSRQHPPETARVVRDVLETLARVHREGVVHGDLKPENVLFDKRGRPVLTDFGLSRRISHGTATLSLSLSREDARIAGTLAYMAPEQRQGARPTTRSDVFSIGVMLYELLTGRRPEGRFPTPGELSAAVPPVFDRLVACALAPEPRHRFADAAAMLAYLRRGLREEGRRFVRALGRAHRLLMRTDEEGIHNPRVVTAAVLVVAGATLFLGLVTAEPSWERALRVCAGAATGTGLFFAAWLAIRRWRLAQRGALQRMSDRLHGQIRAQDVWGEAMLGDNRAEAPVR